MKRNVIADLHNHSNASDGEYTPSGLISYAKEIGLEAIALTDHDTLKGLDEAVQAGRDQGITVIPGVEVSLRFRRPDFVGTLHLLLYMNPEQFADLEFKQALEAIMGKGRGPDLSKARIASLNAEFGPEGKEPLLKHDITFEEVSSYSSNISRRHFAQTLKDNHGFSEKADINKIIGNDSPAYIPSGIEMDLIRPFLRKYSPLTVLAHPAAGSYPPPSHYREVLPPVEIIEKIYPEFLNLGIRGLEVHYPAHLPEHRDLMQEWARKDGLVITGGSDCHDPVDRPLGASGITKDEFDIFHSVLISGK